MTRHPGDGVPRGLGWASWALSLLLAAALLSGCGTAVVNPVTGETERSALDEAAEIEVGRQAHQQVLAEQGRYPDSAVQAYVNGVGQKLAAQSHRAQLKWTFTVLDSPEVNAFALPGGYVYVTRGILAYLESEAELAGVIGHEIGHVTARHGAQRATRQQNAGIGVMAATVFGALLEGIGVPGATDLFGRASQGLAAGYVASYSREQELQADRLGAGVSQRIDHMGLDLQQAEFEHLEQAHRAGPDDHRIGLDRALVRTGGASHFVVQLRFHVLRGPPGPPLGFTSSARRACRCGLSTLRRRAEGPCAW